MTWKKRSSQPNFLFFLFILAVLTWHKGLQAVTIGSDTAVNRFNTQQSLGTGDRVAGFAWLVGGIALTSAAVTATFDSTFPISGNTNLAGGTLVLVQDLVYTDPVSMNSVGNIVGNNRSLEFSATVTTIPATTGSSTNIWSNIAVFLGNNLNMLTGSIITFTGSCILDGRGNTLSFANTSTINVGANSTLVIKDAILKNVSGTKLRVNATGRLVLDNTQLILDGAYSFTSGAFTILNEVGVLANGQTFLYQTPSTSTVASDSIFILDKTLFIYDPSNTSSLALQFASGTSNLELDNSAFLTGTGGLQLTKGNIFVDGSSNLVATNTLISGAIRLGDGVSAANNVTFYFEPAAVLNLTGFILYNDV